MKVFTKVLLRIFAIYFGIKVILAIDQLVYLISAGMKIDKEFVKYNAVNYLFTILLLGIIGLLLWFFNEQISNRIVTEEGNNSIHFNVTYKQLEGIVFRVMGLVLIVLSIEPMMKEIVRLFSTGMNGFDVQQRFYLLISFLNPMIRIVIGSLLVFKKNEKESPEDLSI